MTSPLLLLLATSPSSPSGETASGLLEAASRRGLDADVFLMDAGVDALGTSAVPAWFSAGHRVTVCSRSAIDRRRPLDVAGVDYAGQHRLAELVASSGRFVALTR